MRIGDRLEAALFVIVVLFVAKFILRHLGGTWSAQADNI